MPQDVSPAAQALVAAPYRLPAWDADPSSADEWRALIKRMAGASLPGIAKARETLGVTMQPTTLGGVPGYILMPRTVPEAHRSQVIYNIHGGGYVYGPGESGTIEADRGALAGRAASRPTPAGRSTISIRSEPVSR